MGKNTSNKNRITHAGFGKGDNMQALILGSLFSFGQGIIIKLVSKEALKVILINCTDWIVKSSKTEHDDKIWQDIKPILDKF